MALLPLLPLLLLLLLLLLLMFLLPQPSFSAASGVDDELFAATAPWLRSEGIPVALFSSFGGALLVQLETVD